MIQYNRCFFFLISLSENDSANLLHKIKTYLTFHLMVSLGEDSAVQGYWLNQLHSVAHKLPHLVMEFYRCFLTDLY